MGLICVWGGLEMPGLARFLAGCLILTRRRSYKSTMAPLPGDAAASQSTSRGGPGRGFQENEKFFLLRAHRDDVKWTIPKRAVTHDQELNLRELVRRVSVGTETR